MSYYEINTMPQRSQGFGSIGGPQGPQWQDQNGSGVGFAASDMWMQPQPMQTMPMQPLQYSTCAQNLPTWYAALPVINTIVLVVALVILIFLLFKRSK